MSTLRANELKKLDDSNWVGTEPTQVPTNDMINEAGFAQSVDSLEDLRLASFPASLQRIWLSGRTIPEDGGEGYFRWDSSDLSTEVTNDNNEAIYVPPDSDTTGSSGAWVRQSGSIDKDVTVAVPSTYATLQEAIDHLGKYQVLQGVTITINIESGHSLTSGVRLDNVNYSHMRITSDDAEVTLDAGFTPADAGEFPPSGTRSAIFAFVNCVAPILDCLINAGGTGDFDGYDAGFGGIYKVASGAGVKGADNNLEIRQGNYYGGNTIWDNAQQYCARFTDSTVFNGRNSSYASAFRDTSLGSNTAGAVLVSRGSIGSLQDATIDDYPLSGLSVRRSYVNVLGLKFTNGSNDAIHYRNGAMTALSQNVLVDGSLIQPSDTNLPAFNNVFGEGIAFSTAHDRVEIITGAAGKAIKYPDGRMKVISDDISITVSTADGQVFRSASTMFDYSDILSFADADANDVSISVYGKGVAEVWFSSRHLSGDRIDFRGWSSSDRGAMTARVVLDGRWYT